ncbi:glycosyltransferase family 2 protein [bacterium]|nr:glycosyltransferase family 2 protein [bacterium]
MSNPKISIIIPVYNVEKYLRECLDSCVNQTLEDIEIICVDDASPDNSIKILEEYQAKDPRIKIFRHETNKNLGAARNTGLANATGEYIWFIDSDDYIDSKACQILYDAIKEFDVDMLCFSALRFIGEDEERQFFYDKYYHQGVQINKIYHPKTNWKEINFTNLNVSACTYLVNKNIIPKLRFREGVWHEDADFTPILLASVNSFCYIPYTAYFRRTTPYSITQTPISQKRLEDQIAVAESLDKFVKENKIKKRHFLCKYLNIVVFCAARLCDEHPDIKANNFSNLLKLQKKYYTLRQHLRKLLKKPLKLE